MPFLALYIDIDDVLLRFPATADEAWAKKYPFGEPARGAKEFLEWSVKHFGVVRWLTCWALDGRLEEKDVLKLSNIFQVNPVLLRNIIGRRCSANNKSMGITPTYYHETSVWVEDNLLAVEKQFLIGRPDVNYIYTNTSEDPDALIKTWNKIAEQYELPKCDI